MEEGRKGDCLAFRPHICYCFILIVPSNSKLQAALGKCDCTKAFFFLFEVFFLSFILQLLFFFLNLHCFLIFAKKHFLFLLIYLLFYWGAQEKVIITAFHII